MLLVLLVALLGGCADGRSAAPRCTASQRLALVAQSVPGAAFLPCIDALPPGWRTIALTVDDEGTHIELRSDRADRPIDLWLAASCERRGATPVAPRADGVRSYLRVDSISPRYAGRFYDVFSGGCLTSAFDLVRGPHIVLLDELRQAVGLYPRRQLAQELAKELDVRLDP